MILGIMLVIYRSYFLGWMENSYEVHTIFSLFVNVHTYKEKKLMYLHM